ncbi:MAG TPA: rhomboid family intramembrane serine protease [Gammaproteobacteria bacterium]|nr:rhomboid family intramembrane serine protease [Gammaproteobacteria bacterium]
MFFRPPPTTLSLIIANVAIFIIQQATGPFLVVHFALWPWGPHIALAAGTGTVFVGFEIWQLVTYAFLHGSIAHIFFNMFALYMFGSVIERTLGERRYLLYYFVCVVAAALTHLLVVRFLTGGFYPTIGASGGIFGILLAFGMMYPRERVYFWFALPMPAWVFVTGYGVLELVLGVTGTAEGIAHFAHLGGMIGGLPLMLYWMGKLPLKPRRRFPH